MTVREAIETLDLLKPNQYDDNIKVKWLSELDRKIKTEIIDTHENSVEFTGYDEETDIETELLIQDDYSTAYIYWLMAKVDYFNNETVRYNNDMMMFNTEIADFNRWYNRTYKPVSKGNFKII